MDDQLRQSKDALIAELRMVGVDRVTGNSCRCPFHEDKSASGWLTEGKDHVWRFGCHAASCGFFGDIYDVRAKGLGITTGEILKAAGKGKQEHSKAGYQKKVYDTIEDMISAIPMRHNATYRYTNPSTEIDDLVVMKFFDNNDKKTFRQAHPSNGGYVMESPERPWPIYNRDGLLKSDVALVVEGEKCAEVCKAVGICATSSPCGAGKAAMAVWSPLKGKKAVYLWPDNDDGGKSHMKDVEKILLEMGLSVLTVNPENVGLGPKGDVCDYLDTLVGCDAELKAQAIWDALAEAVPSQSLASPSDEVRKRLHDTVEGKWKAEDWPWSKVSRLTKALLPGTVTLVCGDPGTSKSFWMLQAMVYWFQQKVPVAIFELEEDRTYHLYRALAQVTGQSKFLDDLWVRENADEAARLFNEHKSFLDEFGKCIWQAPDKQMSLDEILEWMKARAKDGCRIVAVDPVTAATSDDSPWSSDKKFILGCKSVARENNMSVVLVTHPKKGRKVIGMEDMSGGAGYSQFSQTILWLEYHKKMKKFMVPCSAGGPIPVEVKANRSLHILKARNGCGQELSLAYYFDGKSTTFEEKGVIQSEQ